jgi:hypothetical protein
MLIFHRIITLILLLALGVAEIGDVRSDDPPASPPLSLPLPLEISLEDVGRIVSKQNFKIFDNAQRIYQSKEHIKFAQANLWPKINIWTMFNLATMGLGIGTGFGVGLGAVVVGSAGDLIQDIAPFLMSANWFKLDEEQILFWVEKEDYRSLWANETQTAKLLFYSIARDITIYQALQKQLPVMEEMYRWAKLRGVLSGDAESQAVMNEIRIKILMMQDDTRMLQQMIASEQGEFAHLLGMDPNTPWVLGFKEIESEFKKMIPLDRALVREEELTPTVELIHFKVLESSPEMRQYPYLRKALKLVRKQIQFSIFGTSSFSVGSGSGPFSHIPVQNGLGFAQTASFNIVANEAIRLDGMERATKNMILLQVKQVLGEKTALASTLAFKEQAWSLAQVSVDKLWATLRLGGAVSLKDMTEMIEMCFARRINLIATQYRMLSLREKLERLTWSADYADKSYL